MLPLTTSLLSRACRIFMDLAYPAGPDSIPPNKRAYFEVPPEQPITSFLPHGECAAGVCQELRDCQGVLCGYDFRLGSAGFPHLKLRIQRIDNKSHRGWVFMVDTHDFYSKSRPMPPADHPDAARWVALQNSNRSLKEKIEHALEGEGMMTPNSILRDALKT